ncbi:MAG: dTDP-4-dehydrorhamnose reductase [Candidatus Saganbacteria bacterium]|nr:dTDP-4-dehydrorhamnose reductase [Candidatus Saganbacteria bacterium]
MRIAVTGADGMLGTDLCSVLSKNHEVIKLIYPGFNVIYADEVKSAITGNEVDLVIHTAAYTDVDGSEDNFDDVFNVNAFGTENVAVSSKEADVPVIYISTDYIFDGKKDAPYLEDDAPNPLNVYGRSKLEGEKYISNILNKYYIIRTSWLFGKAGKNFVKTIISKAKGKHELHVVGDQVGSPTYTRDLAEGIASLIIKKPKFGTYNMTNSGACSWFEFAKKILECLDLKTPLLPASSEELKKKAIRPKNSRLNNSKLEKIGIKLQSWDQALKDYLIEEGEMK